METRPDMFRVIRKNVLCWIPKKRSALIVAKELLAYSKTLPTISVIKKQIKDSKTVK